MCTYFFNMPTNRAVRYAQFHFYMRNDKRIGQEKT